ncbi:MAG: hypothetical protein R2731_14845 [Nocardioides sp.]
MSTQPRRIVAAALLAAALLAMPACTESADQPGGGESSTAPAESPAPVPTTAQVGVVSGRLPKPARQQVLTEVTGVVDGWLDAAYVGGDYPRSDFADAFPRFTADAAAGAQRDVRLLSNAEVGSRISGIMVKRRVVTVDLLATEGEARAATARVRLTFRTQGELEKKVTVAGRLFLTRGPAGRWRIFGYDLSEDKA